MSVVNVLQRTSFETLNTAFRPPMVPRGGFVGCADMAAAVAAGKVSQEILQRYLAMSEGLLAPLMKLG